MLKQYFTDGLVQIAIVLSLLRTDLNSYFNHNYVNYPEVQEIVLGPSALLTQTNFHNNPYMNNQFGYQEIYSKHYYDTGNIFSSSLFRDLRSLRHLSAERQDLDIPTFLIVGESSGTILQEQTDDTGGGGDVNNNVESQQTLSEELEIEGQNLLNSLEESFEAIAPLLQNLGADPTSEDLSLIEVLWRQDIDLGAGKEVFDPNLRRELEREREVELQKERQKQKDEELLDRKLKEQQHQNEQRWLAENFTQDGETGEWVPLGGGRPPPPADISVVPDAGEQFAYDNIPSLSDELLQQQQQQGGNYNMAPQQGTMNIVPQQFQGQQGSQPLLGNQAPPMYNPPQDQFGQGDVFAAQQQQGYNMNNTSAIEMNNTQVFAQQPQAAFNNTQVRQNYNQTQVFNNQMNNFPERSLEQTWQDLVNLLDLPQNQSQTNNAINNLTSAGLMAGHVSPMDNLGSMLGQNPSVDNSSSVLIQNATMPTPAPMNSNMTGFNNTGLVAPCNTDMLRSPAHSSSSLLSPGQGSDILSPGQAFNSTVPGGDALSPLEWDPVKQFLFPNITVSQTEPLPEDVDKLLPDLITQELEEIKFADLELTQAMTPTPTRDVADTSSDSAVSMGSPSLGSPEQNDFSDGAFSPYDGLEGATGGHDGSSRIPKTSKYDPDDYKCGRSCSYSGGDSNSSNFSSTSNDTNGDHGHFGHSGHFGSPSSGHIKHNHTYPRNSGTDPSDIKRRNDLKPAKGPHSRDNKRLEELNIPLTLDLIVDTPVEEFNDMLTRHKLTDKQLQLIRDIRRRGKNKVAAQHCRKRKMVVIDTLEDDLGSLEKMRDKLVHERYMIDKQTREMKEKFGLLYSEIFHSLRDENGRPYDPSRFSLQQSADGDVFLVPRNYTMEDDYNKKRKGERE